MRSGIFLSLLGLPPEWSAKAFLSFFEDVVQPNPSHEAFERMAALFQATEHAYGSVTVDEAILGSRACLGSRPARSSRLCGTAPAFRAGNWKPLNGRRRSNFSSLHFTDEASDSRHTRELLRRYFKAGKLSTPIADREVHDEFIDLTAEERLIYESVEHYISSTYDNAAEEQRNAVGFVMTIYRRRLASSFRALAKTLQGHLDAISAMAMA